MSTRERSVLLTFAPTVDRADFPLLEVGHRYPLRRGEGWVEIIRRSPTRFGETGCHYTVLTSTGHQWDRWDWALLNLVDYTEAMSPPTQLSFSYL